MNTSIYFSGIGKVTFTNGMKMITSFKNGSPIGVRRIWTAGGKLQEMYYFNETRIGPGWTMYQEKYLVYQDQSFIQDRLDLTIIVPLNKSQKILAGKFHSALGLLEDVHSVDLEIVSKQEDCITNIALKLKGDLAKHEVKTLTL